MKIWFSFLVSTVSCFCAHAQNTIGLPQILNFGNNLYQGGTQNWDIKQDISGRMYFANNEGLLIYDGSYWKLFQQPNKSILRSIAIVGNRIYAGGQDEIGYFFPDQQGVLRYQSLKNLIPEKFRSFTDVWEIELFGQSVFFRTWDRIFEYKDEVMQIYPASSGWNIMKKSGGKLIAQDKKTGLMQFINNGWQPIDQDAEAVPFEITGIVALENDSILISSLEKGLYVYHKGTLSRKFTDADNSLIKDHIYCFEQISPGEYVAGTTSQGCVVINSAGRIVQQIARAEGLQNNNILSVYLDRNNNLWAGLDNGISFIAYNSPIKYIKPAKPDELSGYSTQVFDNNLYIATSDGAYFAPLSGSAKDFSFSKGNFEKLKNSSGQAWRLEEVNQQLLLGHHNGSFIVRKNEAIQLTKDAGSWLFLPTTPISPATNILTGTYAGLTMLEFSAGHNFVNLGEIKGMYESLRFMAMDNSGNIWASHPYRGVYLITLADDKRSYSHQLFTEKDGLPSTFRNNVFRLKNRVVFATEKGVYEFDPARKRFIPSHQLFDIFGKIPLQYLNEDADGNIWFCSEKKIGVIDFTIDKSGPVLMWFPELTGKILSGFENVYPYNDENVFIASNTGIIHLNYKKYIKAKTKPEILLTQVKTSGKADSLIFGGYFGRGADSTNSRLDNLVQEFPQSNSSFHFEFSSPSFGSQNNIEYRYYLKGYDAGWSAPTSKTEKEYTNLQEGTYTFQVKAFDNLGNESELLNYKFIIDPPLYKTIWAYFLYIAFALAVFFILYRWQTKKFQQQQLKFEEEQTRLIYIHQLEREKNEKEIIQLQNEKLVNEMIYKNKELADVSMHLVERSDALVKVKDELQRLHKKTGGDHDVKRAIQLVNEIEKNNSSWEQFAAHFDEINNDFIKTLKSKYPNLTSTDLKVCTYLQLKLASKEIAQLMNISVRGVEISRYRLRKKLQLPASQTLNDFLNEIHSTGS